MDRAKLRIDAANLGCRERKLAARIRHGGGDRLLIVGPEHPAVTAEKDMPVERTPQNADVQFGARIDQRVAKPDPVREPFVEIPKRTGGELAWKRRLSTH